MLSEAENLGWALKVERDLYRQRWDGRGIDIFAETLI